MKKRTNKTPNQIEFEKELKRIRRAEHRLQKQGYVIDNRVLGRTSYKRYTKAAIERLKSITPTELRAAAVHESKTGEIISGTEFYKQQRSEAAKRAAETRKIKKKKKDIADYKQNKDQLPTFEVKQYLINILDLSFTEVQSEKAAKDIVNKLKQAIEDASAAMLFDNESYISSEIAVIRNVYESDQNQADDLSNKLISFLKRSQGSSLSETLKAIGAYDNLESETEDFEDYE